MKSKTLVGLFCLSLFWICPASSAPPRTVRKGVAAKTAVKPFTLERIVSRLQDVAKKEYTEAALIRRITKDGVDFIATPQNLARLSSGGASPAMLEAIHRLAPPAPEPPPPVAKPEPSVAIEVTCAPAECSVRFGSASPVTTNEGKVLRKGFKHGTLLIEVTKEGYLPYRTNVIIQSDLLTIRAILQPDLAMQKTWGMQLKDKVADALGGQAKLQAAHSVLAFGDATVWGQGGAKFSCSVEAFIRTPDKAFFRTRAGKRSMFEVDLLPTFRSKSNVGEEEARNLETGLRLYGKYQVFELMQRLNAAGVQLSTINPNLHDGVELHAQTSTEKDTVVLDPDGRPKELREDVPLGEGVRVLYSSYKAHGGLYFPERVTIVYAGAPRQGIEIQFHDISVNPTLKNENDYRLKKR